MSIEKLIEQITSVENSYSVEVKHKTTELVNKLYDIFFNSNRLSNLEILEKIEQCNLILNNLFRLNKSGINVSVEELCVILNEVISKLKTDAQFIYDGDPSAHSMHEVVSCYPGLFAIMVYRVANAFVLLGAKVLPRLMSEYAHKETGIDINPEATIGTPFFIDHGTGVVIGQTAIIGDYVKVYQGVTIGALNLSKPEVKRHPTIEDNVTIYSGATILGGDTIIGSGSVIGGNVWLTKSVKPNSLVLNNTTVTIKDLTTKKNEQTK